ncbi:imidazole glycerol phosphate synthase subunit HisH [Peribacillus psychrosaccharolyticus]|uniref:Imidazole glycerol phosphate synthase subunit HisH n=1 Tax=Peribacillus psychrosaccharolyticus TaxID=1407 RepID=A0A974NK79_PERPY|nr:imidazole glycerol phosphate synthase subunit HisH [Peribacillus psychrosaccharolyticus]MEC2055534.1 imidazole glycerol phosphate synthase subunit HisH [Peribacillus psychrosaccharolyticus]MED3743438.1 imidazole glycerol phosphate synthase subunit HisH [Peribacillus psychrosaccharolyticus]QQS99204.1 imidazole glycerol phosphate synthase subunit HisH [Peribacillus psychrosaccharolyticus]
MIGIVDYGMGNLFSVSKALERIDVESFISDDPAELVKADGILLPGVGSFRDAMNLLERQKLDVFLKEYTQSGGFLLGICLGMQLLFDESEENGPTKGLSLIPGKVVKFSGIDSNEQAYKVPHMGWNYLNFQHPSPLITDVKEDYVYFVHSYYIEAEDKTVVTASADYDVAVPAIVSNGNVYGMQFHPEKSGTMGMQLLKNYIELVEGKK